MPFIAFVNENEKSKNGVNRIYKYIHIFWRRDYLWITQMEFKRLLSISDLWIFELFCVLSPPRLMLGAEPSPSHLHRRLDLIFVRLNPAVNP